PPGHFGLGRRAAGQDQSHVDGVFRRKADLHVVQREEQASQHPGGALVAIDERVIARHAISIGRCQRVQIGLAISPLVAWPPQCRFQCRCIAHANRPAMLGQLAVMDGERKLGLNPDRFNDLHHLTWPRHLGLEGGIGGGDPDAIRRFGYKQRVTHPSAQLGEQFLGQDDTGRIADLGDFEANVHTMVIT
ncbi:hypothetical protein E4T56_gene20888, partial [Termitomyces sp. T112]